MDRTHIVKTASGADHCKGGVFTALEKEQTGISFFRILALFIFCVYVIKDFCVLHALLFQFPDHIHRNVCIDIVMIN